MAGPIIRLNAIFTGHAINVKMTDAHPAQMLTESLLKMSAVYFENGCDDESLCLLNSAHSLIQFPTAETYSGALKLLLRSQAQSKLSFSASQKVPSKETDENEVDLYLEDECDSGPLILRKLATHCSSDFSNHFVIEASILFNKASIHLRSCRYVEAKITYGLVRSWVQGMLSSPVGPETQTLLELGMRTENNIGFINYCEGDEEMALVNFESALLFAKSLCALSTNYDLEYADVLSNACRVAWMLGNINQTFFDSANEVLRIRSCHLNQNHPNVAAAHYNLAMAEYSRQCNKSALSHALRYLQICSIRTDAGYDDLDSVPGLIYLMMIQNDDKGDDRSVELARGLSSLQEKRQEFGPKSLEVAAVLNFVGAVLFHQEDYENSLLFFQEELRIEIDLADDVKSISTSVTCNNIGRIFQEMGNYHDAIAYYRRSLRTKYGDISTLSLCSKTEKNIKIIGRSRECSSSSSTNLFSTVWYNLGLIHDKLASYEEAIFAFEMSLDLRRDMLGTDHPDIACLLYNIGVLRMERQQLDEASACFREALRVRRKGSSGQLNDRHVVITLEKLSLFQKEKGNIKASLEVLHEVLLIQEQSPDFDGNMRLTSTGTTFRSIAELYHGIGDLAAAMDAAEKSVERLRVAVNDSSVGGDVDRDEQISNVEQLACSLLLVGSLYHEMYEPLIARGVLEETTQILSNRNSYLLTPSLAALQEVTSMLSSWQCAPQA